MITKRLDSKFLQRIFTSEETRWVFIDTLNIVCKHHSQWHRGYIYDNIREQYVNTIDIMPRTNNYAH